MRHVGLSAENSPRVKRIKDATLVLLGRREYSGHGGSKGSSVTSASNYSELPEIQVDVLLYCPVAPAGLTTQATQITRIFDKYGISYQLTYFRKPEWPEHPLAQKWVPRSAIARSGLMIFMERVDTGIRYFHDTPKVMYTNLDWLKEQEFCWARQYMQVILHPVDYRLDFIRASFTNARTHLLKWPPVGSLEAVPLDREQRLQSDGDIHVLYVGNDYDSVSRKHPREVVDAILNCGNPRLRFWLKFRSSLPAAVEKRLLSSSNVERLFTTLISDQEMEDIYRSVDINLIPNASEGNGLSIIEALAKGVVPAVLDGYPMKTVIDQTCGYLIPCQEVGRKRQGLEYRTSADDLRSFLESITHDGLLSRQEGLKRMQASLTEREQILEETFLGLVNSQKLPTANPPAPDVVRGSRHRFWKSPKLIDVYLSTYQRPHLLQQSLAALLAACDQSPYEHRITVLADSLDGKTYSILGQYVGKIDIVSTTTRRGLPFLFNMLHDHQHNQSMRTERHPDFINYIQDDCLVRDPSTFFSTLVNCYQHFDAQEPVGYVSGYYTPVHPGFEKTELDGLTVVRSDSIDGKHFFGTPRTLERVGKLTWYFDDGMARGNPGPTRGSHFDLWQWSESPASTSKQGLVNLLIPGLCAHLADKPEESTWSNDTTSQRVKERITEGRVYRTRLGGGVQLAPEEFFDPKIAAEQ